MAAMNTSRWTTALLVCGLASGCATFAPPSPLATFGGPATTPAGTTDLGLALGAGAVLNEWSEGGGGAFLRVNHGFTDNLDLGIDAVYAAYDDDEAVSAKLTLRCLVEPKLRLEMGVGAADSSGGQSTNYDIALTTGSLDGSRDWNWYATGRIGGASGMDGQTLFTHADDTEPTEVWLVMTSFGLERRLDGGKRFIVEGGVGYADTDNDDSGLIYLTAGMLFNVGRD